MRRPGSGAPPPPTARPLGGLPGPVWGVRGRTLSHLRLPALWAGCRGQCGASGAGRSPTPNCPPSGRAAGACVGRPGSSTPPPLTARPLGGLTGPVWGVRGQTLSHPRLPALWAGCRGRCGASGVGRSPTPDSSPSGRAAGAGVGRPGSGALPPPTTRPLGGLPGPLWGVRGRALSHPRLLALWAGCRDRCGASGVGRSPDPDCPPSGRAAGAGVGRPGSDALPPPTARPLGGLPVPVWGVRGRALSHPRLLALWAGCRGRCGVSRVGRSPTPDCPPSGRAVGAGVGLPGSGALPPPTARPLGGLPWPVWGVRGRTLSRPRLPALWAGCRGWCGASGVGRSPAPDCLPSGRAAGAGVGRPGSDALPGPAVRPLGGLPGPVWGVWGQTLPHPRLLTLWAGCWGRCGASGVGHSPSPNCRPSWRADGAGVGRSGSDALPPPTARPLGGLPGPVWGVRGRTRSHPQLPALSAGCRGRCGASGVGHAPTPNCPPSGRAAGAGVWRPGSGALPPPTARPLGGLPGPVWGVRGRTLSHPRLPALWAGCPGRCGASGVGCCACACPAWPGRAGRPPGRVLVRVTFPLAFLASLLACSAPSGLGLPCLWLLLGFFASCPTPPPCFFFPSPPPLFAPLSPALLVFRPGVPWALASCCPPSPLFVFFGPPPLPVVTGVSCFPVAFGLCAPPPFCFFFPVLLLFFLLRVCSVCSGVSCCVFPVLPVRCAVRVVCAISGGWCCWFLVSLPFVGGLRVALVAQRCRLVVCVGSGARVRSGHRLASSLWCPNPLCCVLWHCAAVLLRVVPRGVALLCTVLFCFALFGAAARHAVSWGAVLCLGVLCLLAPCFDLSPHAACVLLWCVAAWCCSPLCFVPCAPWGVVLCVSCRLRPVRCCCVARSSSVPCFPVLCPAVLCCRLVPWCPVLLPCWVCFSRGCGCTYS